MEQSEYRRLYELEDNLWWFRGMEQISLALLDRFVDAERRLDLLDAGCGTGGMLSALARYGTATGLDLSQAALRFARERDHGALTRGSVAELPFTDDSFDLVTSFDVLYHLGVSDDVEALREIARVIRPGGTLLVRVPAYESLRSQHDEAVHTRQRYGKQELTEKLRSAGLEPVFVSFANCLLFPVAVLRRGAERVFGSGREGSEVEAVGPVLNKMLLLPLRIEAWLLRRTQLPFGLSLVAVARKPGA
jgi:SAM-dependent methyltransferase